MNFTSRYSSTRFTCPVLASHPLISIPRSGPSQGSTCNTGMEDFTSFAETQEAEEADCITLAPIIFVSSSLDSQEMLKWGVSGLLHNTQVKAFCIFSWLWLVMTYESFFQNKMTFENFFHAIQTLMDCAVHHRRIKRVLSHYMEALHYIDSLSSPCSSVDMEAQGCVNFASLFTISFV